MVRAINEDACLAMPELGLWAVADGMGGHEAGDVASQMIVKTLQQTPLPLNWPDFLNSVREALHNVNRQLREESAQRYQNHDWQHGGGVAGPRKSVRLSVGGRQPHLPAAKWRTSTTDPRP
jgi:serine/threonine protein phosphatase PrpC